MFLYVRYATRGRKKAGTSEGRKWLVNHHLTVGRETQTSRGEDNKGLVDTRGEELSSSEQMDAHLNMA